MLQLQCEAEPTAVEAQVLEMTEATKVIEKFNSNESNGYVGYKVKLVPCSDGPTDNYILTLQLHTNLSSHCIGTKAKLKAWFSVTVSKIFHCGNPLYTICSSKWQTHKVGN